MAAMSDDLVKRLRGGLAISEEAADRIEELEGQLQSVLDRETSILRYYDAKIDEAYAKLAVAVDALEDVNTFGDCGLQHMVRPALAKIKGE